jgi:uncharacterized protein (TIGR04255 family)
VSDRADSNYARPPITEAMLDVRFATEMGEKKLQTIVKRLKKSYPNSQPLQTFNINIDTSGGRVGLQQEVHGFRLANDDQTDVVVVMPNGITVARLAPYPGWPSLLERFEAVWEITHKAVLHDQVARLGVRTINRIDIPLEQRPAIMLQNYLNFFPQVPPISTAAMVGFLMQVTKPTVVPVWTATITSTLIGPPPIINHLSLLLDIDLFRTEGIPYRGDELLLAFDQIRSVKNEIFEQCITDESRRLFTQ